MLLVLFVSVSFCAEEPYPLEEIPKEKKYKFSKIVGKIKLKDLQQFEEDEDDVVNLEIDRRVEMATKKMMEMTIEDNIDHIEGDTVNFNDFKKKPKVWGANYQKKKYKNTNPLKKSKKKKSKKKKKKRALLDSSVKKHRTFKIIQKAGIEIQTPESISEVEGTPVDVINKSLKQIKKKIQIDNSLPPKNEEHNDEKDQNLELKEKTKETVIERKLKLKHKQKKSKKSKRKLKDLDQREVLQPTLSNAYHKHKKMHMKLLVVKPQKKHHKKKRKLTNNRKLMMPGGGSSTVIAPNQGSGIANAQVVVNSLGTPATIPYAEGNAVPAYAPEDTAPKVIVTRMKMPSNLPY
jgi:hypothetical protein